jgi:RNA polymerase sigma factor (sigma-70 family)
MQSPRSQERSVSDRPRAPAAATELRARLKQASERLLPRIRKRLSDAGLRGAPDLDDQARDALQEVFVEALRSEGNYDPSRDPDFWLHGIAMNVVHRRVERFWKARGRLPVRAPSDDEAVEALHDELLHAVPDRWSESPEDRLAHRQEAEALLATLPEQHREVLRLYYLEHDQDNDAVAVALGILPDTARVRRFRALRAARKGSSR